LHDRQVWAVAAPDAVAYSIEDSRSTAAAKKALRDFQGVVIADGYGVYPSLAAELVASCSQTAGPTSEGR